MIAKCVNENCEAKENCYRYKASVLPYQVYADFGNESGKCEYFIPVTESDVIQDFDNLREIVGVWADGITDVNSFCSNIRGGFDEI